MYGDEPETEMRHPSEYLNEYAASIRGVSTFPPAPTAEDTSARQTSMHPKQLPPRGRSNDDPMTRSIRQAQPPPLARTVSWEQKKKNNSNHPAPSPSSPVVASRDRSPSDTATSQFPLNDIDYESSPAAVAQELSNLQALRRMSMSVGATDDPDLPQLSAAGMPSAPSSSASEDDASRLFWVPARLHPELAPKEFKTFLESKAEQIKRRSGELSAFASPSSSRSSSLSAGGGGGSSALRRKKSMLSRQIDSSVGYQDGAERLEQKKSQSQQPGSPDPNLQELEALVANGRPRISLESADGDENGDIILPSVPGSSLKRSTRTTYRRGGSVKGRGDRATYAQRAARRAATAPTESTTTTSSLPSTPSVPPLPNFHSLDVSSLAQTLRDPSSAVNRSKSPTNFSRPAGRSPSPPSSTLTSSTPGSFDSVLSMDDGGSRLSTWSLPEMRKPPPASKSPPTPSAPFERKAVPQIVEVPPPEDTVIQPRSSSMASPAPPAPLSIRHPERVSSREKTTTPPRPSMPPKQSMPTVTGPPASRGNVMAPPSRPSQSLDQPSPLPGNDTNTSNLSFIPTLTVDKRADAKKKEEPKKSGWGWLLGKEDGDKDKADRPAKAKVVKPPQQHDNTRLDVLQTSIDGASKGRESLVLDRESLKLDEERKKESQRKSPGHDQKKEKEGLFSSIFGGKKVKGDKDGSSKKHRDRGLSPEPPYRELKPDIDYNWTRFSILEERAIYRMAHIKLANPRRALYSQVLLSNFMYSYLAKVQQMHPQMNLPTSAKQQRKQPHKEPQPEEFTQYQRYQQVSILLRPT